MDYIPAEALPLLVAFGYLIVGGPLILTSFIWQDKQYRKEMQDDE